MLITSARVADWRRAGISSRQGCKGRASGAISEPWATIGRLCIVIVGSAWHVAVPCRAIWLCMLAHPDASSSCGHWRVLARTDEAGLLAQVERCRLAAVPSRTSRAPVQPSGVRSRSLARSARPALGRVAISGRGPDPNRPRARTRRRGAGDRRRRATSCLRSASAPDRREVERHGELLAAEVTARLCGTLPGGAIVRVTTLPFDPEDRARRRHDGRDRGGPRASLGPNRYGGPGNNGPTRRCRPAAAVSARCFICASGSSPPIGSTWPTDPTSRNSTRPRPTHGPWSSRRDSCAAQPMAGTRLSWSRCISPP